MSETTIVRCDTCRYWYADGLVTECRRNAPVPQYDESLSDWQPSANYWCGEWQPINPAMTHEAES